MRCSIHGSIQVSLVAGFYRFPGEDAGTSVLAQFKPESWVAYLRYLSVWQFGDDLLNPEWSRALISGLVHVGYGLVFLGLAQLATRRRDL